MLKERLQEEWSKITSEELKNLDALMPRRLQEVIDAHGGLTKY